MWQWSIDNVAMRVFKVTLSYDGSDFSGFQSQSNARSVQAELDWARHGVDLPAVLHAFADRRRIACRCDVRASADGQTTALSC